MGILSYCVKPCLWQLILALSFWAVWGNTREEPVLLVHYLGQRPTTVFQLRPDPQGWGLTPRAEVAMIFQAMRTLAWALPLDSFMSGVFYILYSMYHNRAWLLSFLNGGASCSILTYPSRSGTPDPHMRFLSRMKIQGLKWGKGQMNGPSPKPQSDPLTSWSWLMRWVSSILFLLLLPPPASECVLP